MLSHTLEDLLEQVRIAIHNPQHNDDILKCPASTLQLLSSKPAVLIKFAHSKIHSYQFRHVPACWGRLFTDASVLEAARIIQDAITAANKGLANKERKGVKLDGGQQKDDWVQETTRLLDMALIITGAPERRELIEILFATLEAWLEDKQTGPPRKRRRKEEGEYFTTNASIPAIRHPIPKVAVPSMENFEKHLLCAQPLVITDALTHWPAFSSRLWRSPSYLLKRTLGGRRLIPVEIGRSYTDEGWGQSIITFEAFMDRYMLSWPTSNKGKTDDIAYLAQYDLFVQIPSLRKDISVPDYCYIDPPAIASQNSSSSKPTQEKLEEPLLNAWFGPAGTVSPLHTDPYHNILCQVVGRKYVRLYKPEETPKLYPCTRGEGGIDMSNTSQVDVEGEKRKRDKQFPLFKEGSYVETVLEEGQALYIPIGWWHYIRALEVSFSVSFWWN